MIIKVKIKGVIKTDRSRLLMQLVAGGDIPLDVVKGGFEVPSPIFQRGAYRFLDEMNFLTEPSKLALFREEIDAMVKAGEAILVTESLLTVNTVAPVRCESNGQKSDNGSIGIISIQGSIAYKESFWSRIFGLPTYEGIKRSFAMLSGDESVKAILMVVNSPGGNALGMAETSNYIYSLREKKPILAFAEGMMLSAAYGLGSAAEEVYVMKEGDVGSIGVLMQLVNFTKALEMEGIEVNYVYAGEEKIDLSPYRPLPDRARSRLQKQVDALYESFTELTARNRGTTQKAMKDTKAALFMGEEGVRVGLVDGVKTYKEMIARTVERAGGAKSFRASTEFVGEATKNRFTNGNETSTTEETVTDQVVVSLTEKSEEVNKEMPIDLKKLQTEDPVAYAALMSEATVVAEQKTAQRVAELQSENTKLKEEGVATTARINALEKVEALRTMREQKVTADGIWASALKSSEIPDSMYGKVMQMINHQNYVKENKLDEAAFAAAVKAEIEDWESKGAKQSVMGFGGSSKEKEEAELRSAQEKAEVTKAADAMLAFAGQPQKTV